MSNVKISLLAGGVVVLTAMAGVGGFYAGQLSAKVQFLEGRQVAQATPTPPSQYPNLPYGVPPAVGQSAPVPTIQAPAPIQSPLNSDGVPHAIAPVLADAKSANGILDALSKASAIVAEGEAAHEQPIYAFFDPRCPYCKNAMTELNGKAKINWIPVATVGPLEPAADLVEGMKTLPGAEAISSVVKGSVPKANASTETQGQLQNNLAILSAIYEGSESAIAVPTFLIPRGDGTVMFYPGYDRADPITKKPGDSDKLLGAYGS
ncbi:hypothetical protein [Brucella intermedia]|uniref:hypothetical protein n=1 Tax=Brucella intermedia TaxID=94625 RepID=UPI00235E7EB1|nr:hypothetical protein [Brucella intermedia]